MTARLLAIAAVVWSTACSPDAPPNIRRYQLTATVVGADAARQRVRLAHDAVPGLMPAMTMDLGIKGEAPPLREGDRVVATLAVSDTASWLENLTITGTGPAAVVAGRPSGAAPRTPLPDFLLVDQNGGRFSTRQFAGRVLVITFVYTRCPLPDFCPLMVKHLEAVRARTDEDAIGSRIAFLGVTLDPAFDTPAVLRAYGERVLEGADRFDRWTLATGTPAQIADVARFFGVDYRAEGGVVIHTLATAVIGADGRVMRVFDSNSWRPEEILDEAKRGMNRGS